MISKLYLPNSRRNDSVVIGLPGFMHRDEEGRIDWLLEELCASQGISGVKVNFPGITRMNGHVMCNFNLKDYIEAVKGAVNYTYRKRGRRVGIITSSISSGVVAQYLASEKSETNPLTCIVSISPLLGWNQFLTPRTREVILERGAGIDLTTEEDKTRGLSRHLPLECMDEVQKMDTLKALENYSPPVPANVLTLIGEKDNIVNPEDMVKYHYAIGGQQTSMVRYQSGHNITHKDSRKRIIDFLVGCLT